MMENLKNKHGSIRANDLNRHLAEADKPLVIDVRPGDLFAETHVPGSINIPQAELSQRRAELPVDLDSAIVMVCGIGKFSKPTTLYLKSLGYRNARSLKGGINEWVRKELPTESGEPGASATGGRS